MLDETLIYTQTHTHTHTYIHTDNMTILPLIFNLLCSTTRAEHISDVL